MPIRKRKYASGAVVWQLDVLLSGGKRVQRSFPTKSDAQREEARLLAERRAHGDAAAAMPHTERLRFADAARKLEAHGVTLEQAVEWAIERAGTPRREAPLEELMRDYIADRERRGRRPRYVDQLRVSLRGFVAGKELRPAQSVTRDDVKAWLRGNAWAPATQRNYLGDLRGMFTWGKSEGYCAVNPCEGIALDARTAHDEAEISAFGPETIEHLFTVALSHIGPRWNRSAGTWEDAPIFRPLLGYLTLATFCGIRPEEIKRSPVTEIDFEHRVVIVAGARAKTRQRRVVDLTDNTIAWIRLWQSHCPAMRMIVPKNFRAWWERLRETAGLKSARGTNGAAVVEWPHDVLRHTFATMHFATHQNTALLQAQLGHAENEATLFRRYRAVKLLDGRAVTRAVAQRFWAIAPPL